MKNIITAIIAIACIVAGGVGGHFIRSMGGSAPKAEKHGEEKSDAGHGEKKDDHAKPEKKADKKEAKADGHGKSGGDGHGKEGGEAGGVIYFKFSREFVVPVVSQGRVTSLVILNLNLEADADMSQKLFEMEPKLRDNIMTTLITISNDGQTFESMTDLENYESIRSMVMMNLKSVMATGIHNVLIVDLAKQDL
jgi:flagellar basal body-associated protein FliL